MTAAEVEVEESMGEINGNGKKYDKNQNFFKREKSETQLPCFLLLVRGLEFKMFKYWKQNKSL